jgi:hypothetical protein
VTPDTRQPRDFPRAVSYTESVAQPEVSMMLSRTRNVAAALLSLVVAGACGSDSATSSLTPPADDVTLIEALSQLSMPATGATNLVGTGIPSALPGFDAAKCVYTASSQSFVCAPVTSSGLTFTQSYTLLDASGNKQSAFSPTTTSAIRASTAIAGSFSTGSTNFTVDGKQDLTLSGLLGSTHTLDGTGTTNISETVPGLTTPFVTRVTTAIDKVVLPAHATGAAAIPTSGTMSVRSEVLGTNRATFDLKITFIGSGKATVTTTAAGISQTCTLNLATPGSSCQ